VTVIVTKAFGRPTTGVLAGRADKLFFADTLAIDAAALRPRAIAEIATALKPAFIVLKVLVGDRFSM
jgi:hypothetical protein